MISVAICTWNRAKLLDKTLSEMQKCDTPKGIEWELLIVDNNSSDETQTVIQKYQSSLPIRSIVEVKQGLSNARNCAVKNAKGDLIVWTDDDVLVGANWLEAYSKASQDWPESAYFGGPIEPWFEVDPNHNFKKLLPQVQGAFALVDYGEETRHFRDNEAPFGANMAFRAEHLKSFTFNPNLGRVGTGMIGDDETNLLEILKSQGHVGVWIGNARVKHFLPKDRATWDYVWRYYQGLGETVSRRNGIDAFSELFGKPRWMLKEFTLKKCRSIILRWLGNDAWLADYKRAAYLSGVFKELSRFRKSGGKATIGKLMPEGGGL